MIPMAAVVVSASTQPLEASTTKTSAPAVSSTAHDGRTTPVPSSGGFSMASPRSGSARPRTTSTTMITRNGIESAAP